MQTLGYRGVALGLSPAIGVDGPGTPAVYTLVVTNTGSLSATYDISLKANGAPLSSLSLTPYVFNAASLHLTVTPDSSAAPGLYDFSVMAAAPGDSRANATITGTLEVSQRGVQLAIQPPSTTLNPIDTGVWQVVVTNTGTVADSYVFTATSIVAPSAQFTPASVNLNPGQSQTVQLTADNLRFALPQTYEFGVTAQSLTDSQILAEDTATVAFSGYEAVEVGWLPISQTLTNTLQATYALVITNTGNVGTTYALSVVVPDLSPDLRMDQVYIPPHITAVILATIRADAPGTYLITGQAASTTSAASDSDTATLTIPCNGDPDVNRDGVVTILDISAVAERWHRPDSYLSTHDLNCNGVIDIVDIQLAANAFR